MRQKVKFCITETLQWEVEVKIDEVLDSIEYARE